MWEGEFEQNADGLWEKTSTKGDEIGVDFYHYYGMDSKGKRTQTTYVTDRKGNWNSINNGKAALNGEQRANGVNWETIYREWQDGTGPARSYFEGAHPSNGAIKNSYLYQGKLDDFIESGANKGKYDVDFSYPFDLLFSINNMQAEMMGTYNDSFYKLGDKVLSLIQDSKSRTSFYYHLPVCNFERGQNLYPWLPQSDKQANTYQTYLFFK